MAVWFVLIAGVTCVLLGILVVRLHAAVALLLGATLVAGFTPESWLLRHELDKRRLRWQLVKPSENHSQQAASTKDGSSSGKEGSTTFVVLSGLPPDGAPGEPLVLVRFGPSGKASVVAHGNLKVLGSDGKWHAQWTKLIDQPDANDQLVRHSDWHAARSAAAQSVGQRLAEAFGRTCAGIAILIAMASIIGQAMHDSRAADVIVQAFLRWFGRPRAALAFLGSGFLLGIPVFFDTVFYLMMPLGRALRARTGRDLLLYTLSIVAGATMSHSLVPPTPGPLFVARELNVDMGLMILAGSIVGFVAAVTGYCFAQWANRQYDLPLRDLVSSGTQSMDEPHFAQQSKGPPLGWALLPVLLPVVLISLATIRQSTGWRAPPPLDRCIRTLGDQNLALMLAAGIAIALVLRQRGTTLRALKPSLDAAISSAGSIILITAAGGTFGATIRQTGIADQISVGTAAPATWLVLAFLVTMAIRTAQGSATVSMITAVGIFSSLATPEHLGFHPVYLALAIGCGSKPLAWMNDSGFWVICQLSGMTEREALRFVTPMSLLMGVAGFVATLLGAWWFPMV